MAVERCRGYEEPFASIAPFVVVDCSRPRMLKCTILAAEVTVARRAEEVAFAFVDRKLVLTSHRRGGHISRRLRPNGKVQMK